MSALALERVLVRRGRRAVLEDVTVRFAAGRLTAVIGPNGAGKSTLVAVAAGVLQPVSGMVRLGEHPLLTMNRRELARRRAYLPQAPRSEWPLSVERVVALGLTPALPAFGGLPNALAAQVERALKAHDLLALRTRAATELSGGELARAMLARATVGDPELLLVDEPTAGLDPRHALDAARRLRARADAGRTVVMATHDLDLAARCADDVVAMRDGRVRAAGPFRQVLTGPILSDLYDTRAVVDEADGRLAIRFGDEAPREPSPGAI